MFERNKRNDSTFEIVRYLLDKISISLRCKNDAHVQLFAAIVYISIFVLPINETKTDTRITEEKHALES